VRGGEGKRRGKGEKWRAQTPIFWRRTTSGRVAANYCIGLSAAIGV